MPKGKQPPGPKSHFLLGNIRDYQTDPLGFLERCKADFGDIVRINGPLRLPSYYVAHPDDAEHVLRTLSPQIVKDKFYTLMRYRFLGNGLLTSGGDYWKKQRKLAQPAFQPKNIHNYAEIMVRLTDKALKTWKDGEERDIHLDMMAITLDIVAKTLFDADVADDAKVVAESLEVAMEHFSGSLVLLFIPYFLPLKSNQHLRRAVQRLDDIMYRIIKERRANNVDNGDLLSRLMNARDDDGSGMTDKQMRDELITLFLAGHETTALTLTYTLYLLSQNPEVEAKLVEELNTVLGGRLPGLEDVPKLTYTDWVVREGMRLYPPAWAIGRETTKEFDLHGYRIRKGAQIVISMYMMQRDPRWFTDPNSFKPERWANDFAKTLPRCAYMPFGEGPRICIGQYFAMMEAVLLLSSIVQRYHLELSPRTNFVLAPSITMRPKHGIQMIVHRRGTESDTAPASLSEPGTQFAVAGEGH
jgi:cytochrome P450